MYGIDRIPSASAPKHNGWGTLALARISTTVSSLIVKSCSTNSIEKEINLYPYIRAGTEDSVLPPKLLDAIFYYA